MPAIMLKAMSMLIFELKARVLMFALVNRFLLEGIFQGLCQFARGAAISFKSQFDTEAGEDYVFNKAITVTYDWNYEARAAVLAHKEYRQESEISVDGWCLTRCYTALQNADDNLFRRGFSLKLHEERHGY